MASNLHTVMTRDEAIEIFDNCILPLVVHSYEQDGEPDWPARREAFNNWTDAMCKDGQIIKLNSDNYETEKIFLPVIKKKTIHIKADQLKELILEDKIIYRIIIEDDIKYIKNILAIPEIKEKIKNCHLIFKFEEKGEISENKEDFICPFDKILSKKIANLEEEEKEYFYHISSSSSNSSVR